MKRVKTGILGLDPLVNGGFPKNSSILIAGPCGTGKTILSIQFLYNAALEGEPGVYISFEETKEKLIEQCWQFGWDITELENKGLIDIYTPRTDDLGGIISELKERIEKINAKRLAVDSLTTLLEQGVVYRSNIIKEINSREKERTGIDFSSSKGIEITRKDIYMLIKKINQLDVTTLLIAETGGNNGYITRDTISEFACDGVIELKLNEVGGDIERLLCVRKLRSTRVNMSYSLMSFRENGIFLED